MLQKEGTVVISWQKSRKAEGPQEGKVEISEEVEAFGQKLEKGGDFQRRSVEKLRFLEKS